MMALTFLLLGALALVNLVACRHAYYMMHFVSGRERTPNPEELSLWQKCRSLLAGVRIPRPRTTKTPADLGPGTAAVRITGPAGITLAGWYCPVAGADALVILFHGYAAEKAAMLPEAKAFLAMEYSVLLVDFRGSGDSSETYTTTGFAEAEDVAAVATYVRLNLPEKRVVFFGQSMGAAAILCAIHRFGLRPEAVIVESVFDSLLHAVRHRFRAMGLPSFPGAELLVFWGGRLAGFNGFAHRPVDYAPSVSCPVLFLHGSLDTRARPGEGRRVFEAVTGPKQFREFSGVGHESILRASPREWNEAVRSFLAGNLPPSKPGNPEPPAISDEICPAAPSAVG